MAYGIIINGLAYNPIKLWELLLNVSFIAIPLLALSYFEYRLLKNINSNSITKRDELLLWITGALRLYSYIFTGPIGIFNLISAYMVRKELKKSF